MPSQKIRTLSFFTALGLVALGFAGRTWPAVRQSTGISPALSVTLTRTAAPSPTHLISDGATIIASPTTPPTTTLSATLTPTPPPTRTPRPTPTPTPDFSLLDKRLETDVALQEAFCRPDKAVTPKDGQVIVPILLYHFVGRDSLEAGSLSASRFNVTAADFELQLALLHRLGYQSVTVSEIGEALSGTLALPARPVAITVDDGWIEQYTHIYPLLQKYHMKATFYIPSTYPVGGRFVNWEQLQELADAGMEIGSHTREHVRLTAYGREAAWFEISDSKTTLEEKLGITVRSLSYPFGAYSGTTIALAKEAGYLTAVTIGPGLRQSDANRYCLNRYEVMGTRSLVDFLNSLPWRGEVLNVCGGPPPATPTPYTSE